MRDLKQVEHLAVRARHTKLSTTTVQGSEAIGHNADPRAVHVIDTRDIEYDLAFVLTKQVLHEGFDLLALASQRNLAGELQQRNVWCDAPGFDLERHGVEIQHTPISLGSGRRSYNRVGLLSSKLRHSHGYGPCHSSPAICFYRHLSLFVPAVDHGPGAAGGDSEDEGSWRRRRALQPLRALLDQDLRHQFRHGCGYGYSHGVSVRHQLGYVREGRRRGPGADAGHGGCFLVLPRVGVPRPAGLW